MFLCVELLESMRGETTDVWTCDGRVELRMCCSEMARMCLCRFWQSVAGEQRCELLECG